MILRLLIAEYLSENPNVKSIHTERLLETSAKHFGSFLGREPEVADLTDKGVTGFIRYRQKLGRAPATVEREAAKLLTLWRYAACCGFVAPPRMRVEKAPPAEPIAFLKWEVRRLFRAAARYRSPIAGVDGAVMLVALLSVCFDTAERIGALCEVDRADIQIVAGWLSVGGWITIRSRKNGGRTIVRKLRGSTARALRKHLAGCPHKKPFGFVHRGTLYYHLARLLKQAGLPESRRHKFHCLRRSHASYLHAAGGNAQESLDHADASTTRRHYFDSRITRTQHAIDRLFNPFGLWDRLLAWVCR
jgi:integrase